MSLNIAFRITVDSNKKKTIKRYVSIFSELCQEFKSTKVPRINYNRLNSHYMEAHYYSKLLIERIGSENMYQTGEHNSRYSFDNLTEKPVINVRSIDINECIALIQQEAKGREKLREKISEMIVQ